MTFLTGLSLAAAVLVKSTALQFALIPLAVGLVTMGRDLRSLAPRLAIIAALPSAALAFTTWMRPLGRKFEEINPLWHRSDFFISPWHYDALAQTLSLNLSLLSGYVTSYITAPLAIVAVIGLVWMIMSRQWDAVALVAAALLPIVFQLMLLEYFPSRYPFPHVWAIVLCAAVAVGKSGRAFVWVLLLLVLVMGMRSWNLVHYPAYALHVTDAEEFLGSGPYSGFGAREAAQFLLEESKNGPFLLLTDPFWGPPADVMFVYLQNVNHLRVYEAWWLQPGLSSPYPLVPWDTVPVWKSHYQRVPVASINFANEHRIYFVTDTNYRQPMEVMTRSAGQLVARFPKRNGVDSIDVYKLR